MEFFEQRGARVMDGKSNLEFTRGGRFRTYFLAHVIPCRERDFLQRISVDFGRKLKNETEVCIRYTVRTFCMLRAQPAGLQDEIRALYALLKGKAATQPLPPV